MWIVQYFGDMRMRKMLSCIVGSSGEKCAAWMREIGCCERVDRV